MNESIISWTGATWNPVHGCHKVSDGCRHCYAETLSLRRGWTIKPWTAPNKAENVLLKPHKLGEPYKLAEPTRIFVNSMSDLFHENIPDWYRAVVFAVMLDTPRHTYQILTKRPERARGWLYDFARARATGEFRQACERLKISTMLMPASPWGSNIWMGTSIEDGRVLHRLETLKQCPAKTRFVSFEPLIGPVGQPDLSDIHWVIVGGESGAGFRPMPHEWAREVGKACRTHGAAFFFKQSAAFRTESGTSLRHSDGRFFEWHQYPGEMARPVETSPHRYSCEE